MYQQEKRSRDMEVLAVTNVATSSCQITKDWIGNWLLYGE